MEKNIGTVVRALGLRPWRSRAQLETYQRQRLQRAIAHAYARVPYYRDLFDRHGIAPDQIRSAADLQHIPISSKNDLRQQPTERILAVGYDPARLRRIQTTGSTGEPFVLYRGLAEKWIHQLFWLRALRDLGQRVGDRAVSITALRSRPKTTPQILGRLLCAAGLTRYALDVSMPAEETLRELAALRPGVVATYPGALARLGEELRQSGRLDIRPRFLATGGEVLTKSRRRQIEETWQKPLYELYGCWEMSLVAWQCRATGLFHVCDDSVVLEVVRDGRTVGAGARGEVVLTSLHARAMPLIRYRLGDLVTLGATGCPCGRPFGTISSIQGRMLDLFRLPGGRLLHPYEILSDLKEDAYRWVRHYQLVQETEDLVALAMVPGPAFTPERLAEFERGAARTLGSGVRLRVDLVDRIEPGPGGKFHLARSLLRAGEELAWHHSEPVR
jgi:phenylacetate-CoA ligase